MLPAEDNAVDAAGDARYAAPAVEGKTDAKERGRGNCRDHDDRPGSNPKLAEKCSQKPPHLINRFKIWSYYIDRKGKKQGKAAVTA